VAFFWRAAGKPAGLPYRFNGAGAEFRPWEITGLTWIVIVWLVPDYNVGDIAFRKSHALRMAFHSALLIPPATQWVHFDTTPENGGANLPVCGLSLSIKPLAFR